ncbi:MAG TPA: glycosyltransferase family A protein [Actinomycetes bacterium]|nr:glycosyltransferase family A protein [Actinomycetes bacterium]
MSVVVPTRDRPELLRRAVGSVLGQSYPGVVECIVVFDQCEPNLAWGELDERRQLRCTRNQRSPGLAGARNTGIMIAEGELVAFCDDDDEWLPDKLSEQVARLSEEPEAAVAGCGILIDHDGRSHRRVPPTDHVSLRQLLGSRMMELHPSTLLVRRRALLDGIGPLDEAIPGSYAEDYEWLLRAARFGSILTVRKPLVRVYWHRRSFFSDQWEAMIAACLYLLDKHAALRREPRWMARISSRIAFAYAACGQGRAARRWARQSMAANPWERRAWAAYLVSLRLLSPQTAQWLANRVGRGL